jgi:hypothetical protein
VHNTEMELLRRGSDRLLRDCYQCAGSVKQTWRKSCRRSLAFSGTAWLPYVGLLAAGVARGSNLQCLISNRHFQV